MTINRKEVVNIAESRNSNLCMAWPTQSHVTSGPDRHNGDKLHLEDADKDGVL